MIERVATSASRSLLSRLPELPCDGTVHSVFEHALNVSWGEREWISLLLPPLRLNPWAVLVPGLPPVGRGERCRISRHGVTFPSRTFHIHLDTARPEDLRIAPSGAVDRDRLRGRSRRLWAWVGTQEVGPSLLDCLSSRGSGTPGTHGRGPVGRVLEHGDGDPFLRRGAEVIGAAGRCESPADRARHLAGLVGLGTGLTPAGDDFLVGYLAGSACFGSEGTGRSLLVDDLPRLAGERTTDLSARMLEAACGNEFAAPVVEFVMALSRSRNGLFRAAEDLLALGGTSGADTLAGALFSVDAAGKG